MACLRFSSPITATGSCRSFTGLPDASVPLLNCRGEIKHNGVELSSGAQKRRRGEKFCESLRALILENSIR
jgi:hypothetical protein